MNGEAVHASPRKTGMIILGGGLPKHHICNANMMRNGADYAVFINTAQEFDGSDSGAQPDEAVSWGKIRGSAKTIKVTPPSPLCVLRDTWEIEGLLLFFLKYSILLPTFLSGSLWCNNCFPVIGGGNFCKKSYKINQ